MTPLRRILGNLRQVSILGLDILKASPVFTGAGFGSSRISAIRRMLTTKEFCN